jgi:predicted regulator of Ras-like GTPase activity (Roadblock/LC7/MglB family)
MPGTSLRGSLPQPSPVALPYMSLSDQLVTILNALRANVPEITASMVASSDGLAIAHNITSGDPARMAAMVATALGLGKRICDSFGGGSFHETSIAGENVQVYVYAAGKGVLAVIAQKGANVGLIHLEARDAAKRVSTVLG